MNSKRVERLSLLRDLVDDSGFDNDFGLLRACVQCVQPEDTACLLSQEAGTASDLRNALLKKVVQDASREVLQAHLELVEHLIAALSDADSRSRQGIAYCLSSLLPVVPQDIRQKALRTFLHSRFIGLRRRGYKAISDDEPPQLDNLLDAWRKYHDPECSWLLVKLLPPEDLVLMKVELLPSLSEGWMVSRLYLRLSEVETTAPEDLLALDGISYCYVLAKLGRSITTAKAKTLIKKYETDDRLGLMVWSLGQMQLWEALVWLKGYMPTIKQKRLSATMEEYSV